MFITPGTSDNRIHLLPRIEWNMELSFNMTEWKSPRRQETLDRSHLTLLKGAKQSEKMSERAQSKAPPGAGWSEKFAAKSLVCHLSLRFHLGARLFYSWNSTKSSYNLVKPYKDPHSIKYADHGQPRVHFSRAGLQHAWDVYGPVPKECARHFRGKSRTLMTTKSQKIVISAVLARQMPVQADEYRVCAGHQAVRVALKLKDPYMQRFWTVDQTKIPDFPAEWSNFMVRKLTDLGCPQSDDESHAQLWNRAKYCQANEIFLFFGQKSSCFDCLFRRRIACASQWH